MYDKFPVSKGHMLIIPRRHVADLFSTTSEERKDIYEIIEQCKSYLDEEFAPDGYNIEINHGEVAGQTIFHLHVHLIPRYLCDIENPKGRA